MFGNGKTMTIELPDYSMPFHRAGKALSDAHQALDSNA
jgi:hypothetical protein